MISLNIIHPCLDMESERDNLSMDSSPKVIATERSMLPERSESRDFNTKTRL